MSETWIRLDRGAALAAAHELIDSLVASDPSVPAQDDLLAEWRQLEALRRKLEAAEHAFVLEVERRGVPIASGHRSAGAFVATLLNLDPVEAAGRVRAAQACGHRRSLIGEVLEPAYPLVAAAQAAGVLSAREERIITTTIEKLPDAAREHGLQIEADLVGFAPTVAPRALAQLAARIAYLYDQDGAFTDVEQRRRNRGFSLQRRPDGSGTVRGEVTAELAEVLDVTFDALAAPKPASDGVQDLRTATQRRHDAVLDALKAGMAAGSLPSSGGVLATVVLTMTEEAYRTGEGFAKTGHGAQVPVREAMSWAGGDYRLFATVLNSLKSVLAYSSCRRLFSENERLAMIGRDGGCSFPGCTAPPGWTQSHHITEWQDSHRTSVDDGCLLCSYHHREFERLGWSVHMSDGRPEWVPPRWLDPEQKPIRPGPHPATH